MKTPSFLIGNDFISIALENRPYTIYKGDARFPKVLEIIKARAWDKLEAALDTAKAVAKFAAGNIQVFDGAIVYKDKQIHNTVVTKILDFMAQGFPYEPLVRFLDKLMENPSNRSVEQLYTYLEKYRMAICDDGDFLAMKSLRANMTDHHTGKIDNSVGQVIKVERNRVSDDPNCACHFGLHVAAENFARNYGGTDSRIVVCKVNPKNVVSVPYDANAMKMRVCEYIVVKELGTPDKVKDFDSSYAPQPNNKDSQTVLENKNTNFVGTNRAYEAHKNGKIVKNAQFTINPQDKKSRKFFRSHTGWILA